MKTCNKNKKGPQKKIKEFSVLLEGCTCTHCKKKTNFYSIILTLYAEVEKN